MYKYQLYISLGDNYLTDSDYFSVDVAEGIKFDEEIDGKGAYSRKVWNTVTIKNKPYDYIQSAVNGNKLFDVIMDNYPSTTFWIKFVLGTEITYGYFGKVDCEISEDEFDLTIKPAIIDQYTDFIENNKTEVNVFGNLNLIKNYDFKVWTNGDPDFWNVASSTTVSKKTFNDINCAALAKTTVVGSILQSFDVVANRQSIISFKYAFVGDSGIRRDLKYNVYLYTGTKIYQMHEDGNWVESSIAYDIIYRPNAYPIPEASFDTYRYYSIIPKPFPEDGLLAIRFINYDATGDYICITEVKVESSTIKFIPLSINLKSDYLKQKYQYEIQRVDGTFYPVWFIANPKDSEDRNLFDYFNTGTDDSPNMILLGDGTHGVHDDYGERYPDLVDIFTNEENSPFYKAEICQLTMYKGHKWRNSIFESWRRHIKGMAIFARDEFYKKDYYYTAQDEIDGIGIEGELEPPQPNAGWEFTDKFDGDKRLWVRTPFNGQYSTEWIIDSAINTTGGKEYNFDWIEKLTSRIEYPINDNSDLIGTAVDFRDICRKIYRSTHSTLLDKEVYSAFFWNDSPYIDLLNIETGQNYHTHETNILNNIAVLHTSDLRSDIGEDSEDHDLNISFNDFFDELCIKLPLIWFIDDDKNLHIEHIKFIDLVNDWLDLIVPAFDYVGDYSKYSFNPDELYATYIYTEVNSGYSDFKRAVKTFDKIVSNKRNNDLKKDIQSKFISTDLQYAMENSNDLENGMILCLYEIVNDEYITKFGSGQKTGDLVLNGDLSISNLLRYYGNYEGVWIYGKINDEIVRFPYTTKCKNGDPFTLKGIINNIFFLNKIGVATASKKVLDYESELTTITPIYRHFDYFLIMEYNDLIEM